ncbi:MAG TPA: IS481 family transposase [Solirubrobacterales bacterium]|nr:IS481 family transposase [Solirubrobacterales bacterium]
MKLHANARTCPKSRKLLVRRIEEENWSLMPAAEAAGISERSAAKWLARWRAEGEAGLLDRSSAPKNRPTQLPADRVKAIEALRRLRMTAAEIAEVLDMALSTVSRWLQKIGLGKRSRLSPPEPPNRYERKRAGELIHVDVKKLGRILRPGHRVTGNRRDRFTDARGYGVAGWEFVHVCVDDATRLAYVEVLTDERGETAAGFLRRAVGWFASMGVAVEGVMSDNGSCYRSHVHARACRELGIRHLRTQPYRPRTNGKAERFIQTLTNRWAYGAIYANSAERTAALCGWLTHYNFNRRHGSLGHKAPATRLAELEQRPE